jgi:transcriptional regulator with XRE-family HTH domain
MITGRQIRAARSLLEWHAEDLAREAGLTRVTVSNIESDSVQPQERTLASIIAVFDKHGVEFLDDEGVRIRKHQIRVFTGKTGYVQFLDHIYDTMNAAGGAIRQFNLSDRKALAYADEYAALHLERMGKIEKLDAKVLVPEGERDFPAAYCSYRWLRPDDEVLVPFYVYDDYAAVPLTSSSHNIEILSVRSKLLAARYTEQFDRIWQTAKVPPGRKARS